MPAELFWAMRGGGGSTFGVLVSATVKAHPDVPVAKFDLRFSSTEKEAEENGNVTFYALLADLYAELVTWSDSYIGGYINFGPSWQLACLADGSVAVPPSSGGPYPYTMIFTGYALNHSAAQLNATMAAFSALLNSTAGVQGTLQITDVPRATEILVGPTKAGAGLNAYIASRLWDKDAMQDREGLLQTWRQVKPNLVQGLAITGPATRDASMVGKTSVTETWRRAYLHTTSGTTWPARNATARRIARETTTRLRHVLAAHAPDMGAYINEADAEESEPERTFWGENYGESLRLKREWDLRGTFWCWGCVWAGEGECPV